MLDILVALVVAAVYVLVVAVYTSRRISEHAARDSETRTA